MKFDAFDKTEQEKIAAEVKGKVGRYRCLSGISAA